MSPSCRHPPSGVYSTIRDQAGRENDQAGTLPAAGRLMVTDLVPNDRDRRCHKMRNFLLGALCGAGVALLYAPMTGRRTRALLRDKATRVTNDTTDFIDAKKRH